MATSSKSKVSEEKFLCVILSDAGGKIVGRTRLHKLTCLLELTGLGNGFDFEYHHYGPYSERLAAAAHMATTLNLVEEEEHQATWGGTYSVYKLLGVSPARANPRRVALAKVAVDADPIELELATTAAFLAKHGVSNPWEETEKRKPLKASDGRLEKAKRLYLELASVKVPKPLPQIV